jgi:hypothetical protein
MYNPVIQRLRLPAKTPRYGKAVSKRYSGRQAWWVNSTKANPIMAISTAKKVIPRSGRYGPRKQSIDYIWTLFVARI